MQGPLTIIYISLSRLTSRKILNFSVLAIFALLLLSPMIGLVLDLVSSVLSGRVDIFSSLILSERKTGLLVVSIVWASAVAVSGILIGLLFATFLWQKNRTVSLGIVISLLALSPIPPYIHALTWSSFTGSVNQFLGLYGVVAIPTTGWLISYWVQLMALVPLAIVLCWIALASVDLSLIDAARIVRPDMKVFITIILRLASPALGAALGFLFLISLTDYSVPSLFGSDNYALDIFARYSASNVASDAFLYAVPLLLVSFTVMFACRSGIRSLAQTPNWIEVRWGNPLVFPSYFRLFQIIAAAIVFLQIIVLFSGLILSTASVNGFVNAVSRALPELSYSLSIAILVIIISLPVSLIAARALMLPGLRGIIFWIIVLVPVAIPAPLIGIGMISFWYNPVLYAVHPQFILPALVAMARFLPFAAIILFVQYRFIDPLLFDAAAVFSGDLIKRYTKITIPLLTPGIFIAGGTLGALTLAELGATLIVAPPGYGTITMRIYNYLHYGSSVDVAGLCLLITLITLLAGICAVLSVRVLFRRAEHTFVEEPYYD